MKMSAKNSATTHLINQPHLGVMRGVAENIF
jgi:hypothetical protein